MSEGTDERISRIEARRKRREQRRLSLDTDDENKPMNGVDESGGGRSRSSTTDSEVELSKALTREEKRQERREKKRQKEMAEQSKEVPKSATVITDFSKREIRERRPSDPDILSADSEGIDTDKENEQHNAQQGIEKKKSGYGSYASALRRGSQGSEVDKRKERYAAAVEGYNIDNDDDDEIELSPRDPMDQQPEVMSTSPVRRIKEDYLTSASGKGREIPHSEEQPTPRHLAKQWPPPPSENEDDDDDERIGGPQKGVVKTFEEPEPPEEERDVDEGHVESVKSLKEQWTRKEPSKPLGVNKPYVPVKRDDMWITHFRPVIDEGEAPKEPQRLQMVR